jgi:hypothetical protein
LRNPVWFATLRAKTVTQETGQPAIKTVLLVSRTKVCFEGKVDPTPELATPLLRKANALRRTLKDVKRTGPFGIRNAKMDSKVTAAVPVLKFAKTI